MSTSSTHHSTTPYTLSDSLSSRYPHTKPSFQASLRSEQSAVFPSYGFNGVKRNIMALRDESWVVGGSSKQDSETQPTEFSLSEKAKALKILYGQLFDAKMQNRVLTNKFDLIDALKGLLEKRLSGEIDLLAARVVQRLCLMNQGRLAVVQQGLVGFLLRIVMDTDASHQERSEACKAVLKVAQSREGVNALLELQEATTRMSPSGETTYSVVQGLVWVLDVNTSQCNSQLLYLAEETLIEICRTPQGRAFTAQSGALLALDNILSRPDLGLEWDEEKNLIQSSDLAITRNACHLVWNVCLDGEGKKLGKSILLTLAYVLHLSIQLCELSLIRLTSGAIMSILVYEPSKPLALEPLNSLSPSNICLIDILIQFFEFASTNDDFFSRQQSFVETDRLEYILDNVKSCIRLASEWPATRQKVETSPQRELLQAAGLV